MTRPDPRPATDRPDGVVLTFEPAADPLGRTLTQRVKALLKHAGRRLALRCVGMAAIPGDPKASKP